MQSLLKKLVFIEEQCGDPAERKRKQEEEDALDEFTRRKRKMAKEMKEVRKEIDERNDLLGKTDNNAATVRMSADIRAKIKQLQKDTEELQKLTDADKVKLEKKKAKGKKVEEDADKKIEQQEQIIELCKEHIEEVKKLEKAGFSGVSAFSRDNDVQMATVSQLPDIDDPRFVKLKKEDEALMLKVGKVGEGVQVLRQMATEMGKEIDVQTVLIDQLDQHVDKTTANLENLNQRLKKTLEGIRSCDRFVLDFILIVIILSIAGYIYNATK